MGYKEIIVWLCVQTLLSLSAIQTVPGHDAFEPALSVRNDRKGSVTELVQSASDQSDRVERRKSAALHRVLSKQPARLVDHGGVRDPIQIIQSLRIHKNGRCKRFAVKHAV